jgi:putative ABC transport system permease protein
MQNSSLGIDHEFVLTVNLRGEKFMGDSASVLGSKQAFQQRLSANPDFIGVTYLNQLPGKITNTYTMFMTSGETTNKDTIPVRVINADPDFVKLMNIDIIDGRNLSYDLRSDLGSKFLINEEAAKQYGIIEPVGSELRSREIVGVVKDFHINSMHSKIEPVAIVWDWWTTKACIKLNGQNIQESIQYVEAAYAEFCPGFGFEYEFLDESFAKQYEAEERLESILIYFVSLAILLSCLGLFALTTLITEQKTKEIGIRKVLGSSNRSIVFLLTNTFTKWIILANIVSWPVAYVVLSGWLTNFEYRISLGISVFILSGILTFLIAFSTTAIQALKSVFMNPVDSLRYE